ncbi:MAG: plasmid maintenance protein CcdB [Gammaproteobacteria bacterium]|nr:plasmid maintenance protein CcdB [Gammaproteobacteria bacterium]
MAQFDIYKNPNTRTKKAYPYILDVQNPIISDIGTRITIPLGKLNNFKNLAMVRLTPEIIFNDEKLLLLTPQIAAIPTSLLKNPVGSLILFRDEIISSIDFAITGV